MTKAQRQAREYAAEAADGEAAIGFELAARIAEYLRRDGMPIAAECVLEWHTAASKLRAQRQPTPTVRGEVTQ